MKKILLLAFTGVSFLVSAQINVQSNVSSSVGGQNSFLDASGYITASPTVGKGLYFPRTDLTQWEFNTSLLGNYKNFKTAFDGLVVYNTVTGTVNASGTETATKGQKVDVKPGFYYFSNDVTVTRKGATDISNGKWIRIADAKDLEAGLASGDFWSLDGNAGTTPVTEKDIDVAQKTYEFKSTAADKNFFGTTDAKNVMFATGKEVNGQMKSIARLEIGEKTDQSVGTKNDFTFVLDVYGKARFRDGIVTSASTYPDYVFDNYFTGKSDVNPNYEFKKLNEVEKFIKENNHLPGVTSIKELTKSENGYNVDNTQLSIQTLEKVEELYLHVIEQQKEIQALKAEIAELKK